METQTTWAEHKAALIASGVDMSPPAPPPPFVHKQRVAMHKRVMRLQADGPAVWWDDWSETAEIRLTKRDIRSMGYFVVRFDDGGEICVHHERLRAV